MNDTQDSSSITPPETQQLMDGRVLILGGKSVLIISSVLVVCGHSHPRMHVPTKNIIKTVAAEIVHGMTTFNQMTMRVAHIIIPIPQCRGHED